MVEESEVVQKFGRLFSVNDDTFEMGIRPWFGERIAQRFRGFGTVLDACCGAGFFSIALARHVDRVIAVDANLEHLRQARDNARLAGVSKKIEFVLGDILSGGTWNRIQRIEAAFLDPDWEAPDSTPSHHVHAKKLSDMQPDAAVLLEETLGQTPHVALRLPKEFPLTGLNRLPPHEVETAHWNQKAQFCCAYFGKLGRPGAITALYANA